VPGPGCRRAAGSALCCSHLRISKIQTFKRERFESCWRAIGIPRGSRALAGCTAAGPRRRCGAEISTDHSL